MSDVHVIIGAGITGLYTTFSLIHDAGVSPSSITVIASYFPGDLSKHYTSPWAGGNFSCISASDPFSLENDRITYTNLSRINEILGGSEKSSIEPRPSIDFFEVPISKSKIESLQSYVKDFEIIPEKDFPRDSGDDVKFGIKYTSWNFYCPKLIECFYNHLTDLGVKFVRKNLSNINEAFLTYDTKYIFNCSGLGSRTLGGVEDTKVYPTRGQVVIIRAPHVQTNMCRWNHKSASYIIPRPQSNGQLVMGGFLQKGIDNGDVFGFETKDIIDRCTKMCPKILDKPLDIIKDASGLRPTRNGGARVELQKLEDGKFIVHNYGAGGYGYQSGYGMATKAVGLYVKEVNFEKSRL